MDYERRQRVDIYTHEDRVREAEERRRIDGLVWKILIVSTIGFFVYFWVNGIIPR